MNTENVQNVGASQEAVVAENKTSFASKAKAVAAKAAIVTVAAAATVSVAAAAACRVVMFIRLLKGDEK